MKIIKVVIIGAVINFLLLPTSVMAIECQIKGMDLLQFHSRLKKNYSYRKFRCWASEGAPNIRETRDNGVIFMPTPTGLICKHNKHLGIISTPLILYRLRFQSKPGWDKQIVWRISKLKLNGKTFRTRTADTKIEIVHRLDHNTDKTINLQSIWVKSNSHDKCEMPKILTTLAGPK